MAASLGAALGAATAGADARALALQWHTPASQTGLLGPDGELPPGFIATRDEPGMRVLEGPIILTSVDGDGMVRPLHARIAAVFEDDALVVLTLRPRAPDAFPALADCLQAAAEQARESVLWRPSDLGRQSATLARTRVHLDAVDACVVLEEAYDDG